MTTPETTTKTTTNSSNASSAAALSLPAKRKSPWRWPLRIGGTLVVLAIAGLALAPTIAGSVAPGIIAEQAAKALNGTAKVKSTKFAWGGPQTIDGLVISDAAGAEVFRGTIETSKGLFGLATGGLDIGELVVRDAKLNVTRGADGQLNLAKLAKNDGKQAAKDANKNAKGGESQPITLPKGLRIRLKVDALDATLVDASKVDAGKVDGGKAAGNAPTTVTLTNLKLSANVDPAQPLDIKLTADAGASGPGIAGNSKGALDIVLQASNWANAQSQLSLDKATIKGDVKVTSLPVAMLDALAGGAIKDEAGKVTPLASVLGEALGINVKIDGSMMSATAAFDANTTNMTAQGSVVVKDGAASQTGPITVRVLGAALEKLAPQLMTGAAQTNQAAASQTSPTTFSKLPDATVTLTDLALKLPKDGAPLDLRGAAANIALSLTETRGTVQLPGQAPQALVIAPLTATAATKDLAGSLAASARTSATLNGQNAGELVFEATLSDLLDGKGAFKLAAAGAASTPASPQIPSGIDARVALTNMATVIAQPFVQSLGLELARDIGATLNLTAAAKSGANNTLDVTLDAKAQQLTAKGGFAYSPTRVLGAKDGLTINLASAGNVLAALTSTNDKVRVSSTGGASTAAIELPFFDIALANNKPLLEKSKAQMRVRGSGLSISVPGNPAPPVLLSSLDTTAYLLENGRVEVGGEGKLSHAGTVFGLGYDVKVAGLLLAAHAGGKPGMLQLADPWSLRPVGVIELGGLPTSLLQLLPKESNAKDANTATLDLAALLREVAGNQLTIKTTFAESAEGGKNGVALSTTLRSERVQGDIRMVASDSQVFLQLAKIDTQLSPIAMNEVLRQFAPDMQPKPRLISNATATLTLDPITVPLDANKSPQLDRAGILKGRLAVPDAVVLDGLAKADATTPAGQQLTRVGVRGLQLEFEAPVASLLPADKGGKAGQAKANLQGGFLGGFADMRENAVRDMGTMRGSLLAAMNAGTPGQADATFDLEAVPAGVLDALSGQPGLISGALGGDVQLNLAATATPAPKAGGGADFAGGTIVARAKATAPNLKMDELALRVLPSELVLEKPAAITLWTTPALVSQFVKAGADGTAPAFTLAQATTTQVTLTQLRLPRASKDASGKPVAGSTPLAAQATVVVPGAELRTRDDKKLLLGEARVQVSTVAETKGNAKPGDLAYALSLATAQIEGSPASQRVAFEGHARNLMDASGAFSMQRAVVDVQGNVPNIPTAIPDVLAQQNGLLIDALGESVQLAVQIVGFPIGEEKVSGGSIDATFTSPRANARVQGNVGDSVLVFSKPATLSLSEITSGLSGRLVKGLPLVGSFTKNSADAPAAITANNMIVPLGKDFSKLSGVVTIDPGEAQFATSGIFNELLNLAKLKQTGQIGRRLEPITVTLTNGVATYPRWSLPLGEFSIATEGKVDLVTRQVDVVTWVPIGALAENAVGLFSSSKLLGGTVLEAASMVPFRTKGPMDAPTTGPDLQLFAETTVKNINPINVIEGIGDLFKKKKPPQ